jgi:lysylphosphatidylglycerol synthetase-like protein (DUF2156 family)
MRSSHSLANIEDSPWSAIRKNWTILTQIGAGVMTVVATVVAPPPTPSGTLGIRPFATFVVAILAGIFLLVLRRFRKQAHALWWAGFTAILLAVTVVDYFWYFNLLDTRTETWHERTIVCGTELRPEIQNKYGSTIRKSRVRELLDDAAGDPQLIWTDQSIRWSKDILAISYLVIVPLIGGCIMAASQIAMCRALPRSHTKPTKVNKQKSPVHSS